MLGACGTTGITAYFGGGSEKCRWLTGELGFDAAVERAKKIVDISRANLVEYRPHYDISDLFRLFGKSDAKASIKVDLGMDMPKLQAGKLYFLSPTFLH